MKVFWFGCWDRAGHSLHDAFGRHVHGKETGGCPWKDGELDTKLAPQDPRQTEGRALFHLRDGWAALSMWDRSVDQRMNCNGTFVVDGATRPEEVIATAERVFPQITKRLHTWPPQVEWADKVAQLDSIIREAGCVATFDVGRDITHPCTFCGKPPETSHELVTIGTYIDGDELTRPVCERCMAIALAKGAKS